LIPLILWVFCLLLILFIHDIIWIGWLRFLGGEEGPAASEVTQSESLEDYG
ncbi:hypothetical protein ACJX0J_016503, partial [Zea mays]